MRFKAVSNSLTPHPIEIPERATVVTYSFLQLRKDRSGGFSKHGQTSAPHRLYNPGRDLSAWPGGPAW